MFISETCQAKRVLDCFSQLGSLKTSISRLRTTKPPRLSSRKGLQECLRRVLQSAATINHSEGFVVFILS